MHRPLLLMTLSLALVAGAACGRYSSNGAHATTSAGDVQVGSGLGVTAHTGVTVGPREGGGGDAAPATTAVVAANESRYDSPQGFRLTLTVGGSLKYRANQDIALHLEAQNISTHDLQYDPNDTRNFAFRPVGSVTTAWTDGNCRGGRVPIAVETSAQTLHPQEQAGFQDTYPGPSDFPNRDQCRVAPGTYDVFGYVVWCPPGSTDSRGICEPSKTQQVTSAGVRITIS